jgi:hypothetical protein
MGQCKWTNQNGQRCGQPASHWPDFSHGNGLLTTRLDMWTNPNAIVVQGESRREFERDRFGTAGPIQKDYEMREGDFQCPWQGLTGRCVLRVGHFPEVAHKESAK